MKKRRLFEYMFFRMLIAITIASVVFYGVFLAFSSKRAKEEVERFLGLTRKSVENVIDAYMSASAGYEIFFEQALDNLFGKLRSQMNETEPIEETVEKLLDEFNPKLLKDELVDKDYVLFTLDGKQLHRGEYPIEEIDDYTLKVLKGLDVGEVVFERLDDIYTLKGKELFVKIGYMRLNETDFLEVRFFIDWVGIRETLEEIASIPDDIDVVKSVRIYSYSLEPFGEIFSPLPRNLENPARTALRDMKIVTVRRKDSLYYIIPKELPRVHDRQFSKPMIYTVEFDLTKFRDWYKDGLVFSLMIISLATLSLAFITRRIVEKVSEGFERLVSMMENFRKSRMFTPEESLEKMDIEEIERLIRVFQEMAEDLTAHVQELEAMREELETSYEELEKTHEELEKAHLTFGRQLAMIAEGYDEATGNHIIRVGELSAFLAKRFGMDEEFVEKIRYYAPLHDIGKILVPKEILLKRGKLSDEEFEIMKRHTIYGAMILEDSTRFEVARNIALYHHEKYDGSGYPHGLKGDDIPLEAQIVALVDVYDALRSERPYKKAFSHKIAMKIILEGDSRTRPENFNPELLRIFKAFSKEIAELWERAKKQGTPLEEKMKKIMKDMNNLRA